MRGTGSLQQLLGRPGFSGRKSSKRKKTDNDNRGNSSHNVTEKNVAPPGAFPVQQQQQQEQDSAAESPIKYARVRCPVCQRQIPQDRGDDYINDHIDKCLFRASAKKSKQQSTLFLFARNRSPSSEPADELVDDVCPPLGVPQHCKAEAIVCAHPHQSLLKSEKISSSGGDCIIEEGEDADQDADQDATWPASSPLSADSSGPMTHKTDAIPCDGSLTSPPICFACCVVGCQYAQVQRQRTGSDKHRLHQHRSIQPGSALSIQPDPTNPRDRNALLVVLDASSTNPSASNTENPSTWTRNTHTMGQPAGIDRIGYLPATVALHLGPLLNKGAIGAEAIVLEIPFVRGPKAPLPIEIKVTLNPEGAIGVSRRASVAGVRRAVHAAQEFMRQSGDGAFPPTASGEHHRRNFKTVVKAVLEHDGKVLDVEELSFIKAYESLAPLPQSLFLRLCQRRGRLFRIDSLNYPELSNPCEAAVALQRVGLAQCYSVESTSCRNIDYGIDASRSEGGNLPAAPLEWTEVASTLTVPELLGVLRILTSPPPPRTTCQRNNISCEAAAAAVVSGNDAGMKKNTASLKSADGATPNRAAILTALGRRAHAQDDSADDSSRQVLVNALLGSAGPVVHLQESAVTVITRLQRLFFLNEGLSLSHVLAVDAGVVKYPPYSLTRQSPAFPSRRHLLEYEKALKHADTLTAALEAGNYEEAEAALAPAWVALDTQAHKTCGGGFGPSFLQRFSAPWVHCMMATVGVSLLERQKEYRKAVDRLQQLLGGCCCPGRRGLWWVRLSTDLEHLGRINDALEVAETALADDSLGPGDRLSLQRRVLRLGRPPRRWKKPIWASNAEREPRELRIQGRPIASVIGMKSRFYGYDGQQCSVEELALQYYGSLEAGEFRGVHAEGGIWSTLFGLLMWPVLFDPEVPDAFRTPFQTAPLDLDTEHFYPVRAGAIKNRLDLFHQDDRGGSAVNAVLAATWKAHQGTLCRGVNWDRWTLEELQTIVECVGGRGLAAVCELFAKDHAGWQGGLPDLLLWHSGRRESKLVEVKGPRDRLSDQQRAWIAALEDAGLTVEVLKVVEPR